LVFESSKIDEILTNERKKMNFSEIEFDDCSEAYSRNLDQKAENDERFVFTSTVHRGTASGGILQKTYSVAKKNEKKSLFPNFNSDNLYGENLAYKNTEIDEHIIYEGRTEMIGCCRMKFFCF
jgi:hypothetical protein